MNIFRDFYLSKKCASTAPEPAAKGKRIQPCNPLPLRHKNLLKLSRTSLLNFQNTIYS